MDEDSLLELKIVKPSDNGPEEDRIPREATCCDGVFTNMAAKPEQMILPVSDSERPPAYNTFPTWPPPRNSPINASNASIDYYDAEFGGLLVEGYLVFFIHALLVVFFEWVGLFMSVYIANSHAGRSGGFFGLGCLLILASASTLPSDHPPPIGGDSTLRQWMRLVGYLFMVGSLLWFSYVRYKAQKIRIERVNF